MFCRYPMKPQEFVWTGIPFFIHAISSRPFFPDAFISFFARSTHVQPCEVRGTGLLWDAVWTQFTHDVGLLKKKIWPIRLKMRLRLICAWRTRNLLDAADSLDIVDRYSLSWKWYWRQKSNISLLCPKNQGYLPSMWPHRYFGILVFQH